MNGDRAAVVSVDDVASLFAELWAMGYAWPICQQPKSDDWPECPPVLAEEARVVREGHDRIVTIVHRIIDQYPDWGETFYRWCQRQS